MCHTAAPKATRTNECMMGRWERWRNEVFVVVVVFLFFNYFSFLFLGNLQGLKANMEGLGNE